MSQQRPKEKQRRKKHGVRLFIALYPPGEVAAQLVAHLQELDLPEHRVTPTQQVHMTVQFLGDRLEKELDDIVDAMQRATSGLDAFDLSIERLINWPPGRPARMIAAETDAPAALRELHQRLVNRFAQNPRPAPDRKFRPHMTLCRFSRPKRGLRVDETVSIPAFPVRRIELMRSTLHPSGARHDLVQHVELR